MSSDKSSIIEKAQKLAAKGQIDKAIEEWQKLIAETPNDGNIYNTIGDLHLKANHAKEAISAYLKAADAFRGAGFELKSIAVYKKIVKIDPSRIDVYEKLADVHAERGLVANAVEDYLRVAKHYAKGGDLQASVAVYRKLANLDPKNFAVRQKLAEICQKWGLAQEAAEEYGKVLEIFKDRQMTSEAQQVIDQVLDLETSRSGQPPVENDASKEKELSRPPEVIVEKAAPVENEPLAPEPASPPMAAPAVEEPLPLSARMEKSLQEGDWLAAEVLMEELRDQPAESLAFLSKWVEYFLEKKIHPKAFLVLQKAVSLAESENMRVSCRSIIQSYLASNPEQISAHQLLGENLEKSGEEQEAIQRYSKIISLLCEQRSETEAQSYYEEVKSRLPGISEEEQWRSRFEPESQPAVEELPPEEPQEIAPVEAAVETFEEALSEPEPISEIPSEPIELGQAEETSLSEPLSAGEAPSETPMEASPVQEISEATFQGHLTEAEVYIKYGLNSKAIEQLTLLSELAPSREEPHIQLKEIYLKEGMREKAADECLLLANLYEKIGAEEKRTDILEEMRSIDPDRQLQKAVEEITDNEIGEIEPAAASHGDDAFVSPVSPGEIEAQGLPMEEALSIPSQDEVVSAAEERVSQASDVQSKLTEAQEYIDNGNKEAAKSLLWKILKEDSQCADARMMLLNLQSAAKGGEKAAETSVDPAADVPSSPEAAGEEFSFEGLSKEIEDGLDHLLTDDSQEGSSPDAGASQEISHPESEGEKEEYVDLKSIFGEELNTEENDSFDFEVPGLDDALNDLKDTSHRTINEQEFETHYNLGIAYKEMGLIPEAIKEFELAFQGNQRFQDASSMLASCYKENGMIDTAIEILQNALDDPRCTKENTIALKYELAMLYDLHGTHDRAKLLYNDIYQLDPNFRDIAVKKSEKAEEPPEGENQTVPPIRESVKPKKGPEPKKKNRISYL